MVPLAGQALTPESCADCDRPASKSYGTLPLCPQHAEEFIQSILERRPDLRVTRQGQNEGEPATWRCETCGAGWFCSQLIPCPWCEERPELDRQIQQSIDEARLRDYLWDVRDGSQDSLAAALHLAKVGIGRGTLSAATLTQIVNTWEQAE